MAQLGKIDVTLRSEAGATQAGVVIEVRKRGATVNGSHPGATTVFTVNHPGAIETGDNVAVDTGTTSLAVTGVTETTVTIAGPGFADLIDDQRLTVTNNLPSIFLDSNGDEAASNPLAATGSDGSRDVWAIGEMHDLHFSGGGFTTVLRRDVPAIGAEDNRSHVFDFATGIGWVEDTLRSLTVSGALLKSVRNAGVEKWKLDKDGATTQQGGSTIVTGGQTITAGGLIVSAGGAAITGNSTITGTLGSLTGLTVDSGGATITAGGLDVDAGLTSLDGGLTVVGAVTLPTDAISATELDESTLWTDLTTTGTDDQSETATTEIAYNQLDNVTFTGDAENQLCYAYFSALIDKDTGGGTLTIRIARRENSAGTWLTIAESVSPALTGGTSHGFAFGGTFMSRRTDVVNNIRVTCEASTNGWGQDSSGGAAARDKRRLVIRRYLI